MSDSNRVLLSYIKETTWGTTPATAPPTEIRMTGESLSYDISNVTSSEIRDDRQVTDLIQSGASMTGGFNFELSYASFDDFIAGALFSTWSAKKDTTSTVISVATSSGNQFVTTVATDISGIVAGQWIRTSGFAAATNNGYHRVTAVATLSLTVSSTLTKVVAGATVTLEARYIRNGITESSFSIERKHSDLSPLVYFIFTGLVVNSMSLSLQASQIVTGSFDFVGEGATVGASAMTSGTLVDANDNTPLNAVSNVANVLENFTAVASCLIQSLDFTINNNLRGLTAIGALGNCDIGSGQVDITGTLNAYFKTKDLFDKYIAGTATSISFRLLDADGNAYIFTFPTVKFESDKANAGSSNQDIVENIGWRALRNATYNCMIQIDKFDV
jgi:hypothetical protein